MRESINIQQQYRRAKTPVNKRRKQYVLFIDFMKAFDKVDRDLLFAKMWQKGYNEQIISSI
jgi:replication-associated recombination protein RarA